MTPAPPAPQPAAAGPRPVDGRRAVHRRRRPGRPRRPLRRPGAGRPGRAGRDPRGLRPAHAAGGAGGHRDHRGHRGRPLLARRRRGGADAVARPGARRRARSPGPGSAAAATSSTSPCPPSAPSRPTWCASSWSGWPARRADPLVAGLEVEAVPGDVDGLRWRTRHRYVVLPDGRKGMRKHRSHDVVPVDDCLIESADPPSYDVLGRALRGGRGGVLAGPPRGAGGARLDGAGDAGTRGRGRRCWTSTPASACSRASWPTRSGPAPAWSRSRATARPAGTPSSTSATPPGWRAGRSRRCWPPTFDEPFDLVVLDPPREGAKRAVVEQVVDRAPARRRLRRLRPGRPGPRHRDLRRARLPARAAAGLRPVPDDAPRRVRRVAGEEPALTCGNAIPARG